MRTDSDYRAWRGLLCATTLALLAGFVSAEEAPARKVKGVMQTRPGGPAELVEVDVYEAPTKLPSVPARQADLRDDDLVLGVVLDGRAMAYPIRFLAQYEVMDHRVGQTPVAPTW